MKDNLEHIDDLFRDHQDGFKKLPSETSWSRLENLLDQVPEVSEIEEEPKVQVEVIKKVNPLRKWLSIAAMLTVISVSAFYFINMGNKNSMAKMESIADSSSKKAKSLTKEKTKTLRTKQAPAPPIVQEAVVEERQDKFAENAKASSEEKARKEPAKVIIEKEFVKSKTAKLETEEKIALKTKNKDRKTSEDIKVLSGSNNVPITDGVATSKEEYKQTTEEPSYNSPSPASTTSSNGSNYGSYGGTANDNTILEADEGLAEEIAEEEEIEIGYSDDANEQNSYDLGNVKMESTSKDLSKEVSTYENTGAYGNIGRANQSPYDSNTGNALSLKNAKYNPLIGTWKDKQDGSTMEVYRLDPNTLQFNFISDNQLQETVTLTEDADGIILKQFSTSSSTFFTYNENEVLSKKKVGRFETADGKSIEIIFSNKNKIKWFQSNAYGQVETIFIKQ